MGKLGIDLSEHIEGLKTEISKRNAYWLSLRSLKLEYAGAEWFGYYEPTDSGFGQYVREKYGFRIQFDNRGNITSDHTIEDEKLYLAYLLKHR